MEKDLGWHGVLELVIIGALLSCWLVGYGIMDIRSREQNGLGFLVLTYIAKRRANTAPKTISRSYGLVHQVVLLTLI